MKAKEIKTIVNEENIDRTLSSIMLGFSVFESPEDFMTCIKVATEDFFQTYLNYALQGGEEWKVRFVEKQEKKKPATDLDLEDFLAQEGDEEDYDAEDDDYEEIFMDEEERNLQQADIHISVDTKNQELVINFDNFLKNFKRQKDSFFMPNYIAGLTEGFYNGCRIRYIDLRSEKKKGKEVSNAAIEGYEKLFGKEEADFFYNINSSNFSYQEVAELARIYELAATGENKKIISVMREKLEEMVRLDNRYVYKREGFCCWTLYPSYVHGREASAFVLKKLMVDLYKKGKGAEEQEEIDEKSVALLTALAFRNYLNDHEEWRKQENVDVSTESYDIGRVALKFADNFNESVYFNYLKGLYDSGEVFSIENTFEIIRKFVCEHGRNPAKMKEFAQNIIEMAENAYFMEDGEDDDIMSFYSTIIYLHKIITGEIDPRQNDFGDDGDEDDIH
ncbi:MAG: hypothetical protein J6K97_04205 [Clostridia bacterium]|nr:hypothetical protein [Clostridia bacterium]